MGTVVYLDQIKPAGSLRAFAGPMVTATAPPKVAYVYDLTDFSCVVLHSSAYRDGCSWRAVALTLEECEAEALAHHVAEHPDIHGSAGRTIIREPKPRQKPKPKPPVSYLDRCVARLRSSSAAFVGLTYGRALARLTPKHQPFFRDALEVLAADESDPALQAWAQGCERRVLVRAENPDPAHVERLVRWMKARRMMFLRLGNVGHVRRQIGPPRRDLAVNALEVLAQDASDAEMQEWAQGLIAKWEAKQAA